jgi:hypothetical protein
MAPQILPIRWRWHPRTTLPSTPVPLHPSLRRRRTAMTMLLSMMGRPTSSSSSSWGPCCCQHRPGLSTTTTTMSTTRGRRRRTAATAPERAETVRMSSLPSRQSTLWRTTPDDDDGEAPAAAAASVSNSGRWWRQVCQSLGSCLGSRCLHDGMMGVCVCVGGVDPQKTRAGRRKALGPLSFATKVQYEKMCVRIIIL